MSFAVRCFWWCVFLCVFAQVEAVTFNTSLFGNASFTSAFNISGGTGAARPADTSALWRNNTLLQNVTSTSPVPETRSIPISSGVPISSSIDPMLVCDDAWSSWYSSSLWTHTVTSMKSYTKVIVETQTVYESTWTCSSTCGDVCYADATATDSSIFAITTTSTSTDYWFRPFNNTTPSCSIPLASCTSIHSVWSSSVAEYIKWEGGWWFETPPAWPWSTPGCKWCNNCYITARGKVQLFYWPVPETVTRDMCTNFPTKGYTRDPWNMGNYSTASYTEVTTGPPVVLSGHTFYPGNVYLSIPTAGASDSCTSHRGKTYSNIMLTLASGDIYSNRAGAYGHYPIDYADFNTPYPWSAYKGALPACDSGMNLQPGPECTQSTVFNDRFHPVVNIPISIQHLDPDWKGCRPIIALVDPPVALQSRTSVFATEPAPPIATSVQPAPAPQSPPIQTRVSYPKQTTQARDPPTVTKPTITKPTITKPTVTKPPVVTIGPSHFPIIPDPNGNGGVLVLNPGTTVQNCGPAATVGGTTVSACNSGVTISDASGTRTVSIPNGNGNENENGKGNGNEDQGGGVISIGGETFVVDTGGNLIKPATIMKIGDPAMTINGMAVSAGTNGIEVVDPMTGETKTIPFVEKEGMEMITVGNNVMSIAADGGLVLGPGTTLHAGDAAVTVDGEMVNVGKDGGVTVVGPSGKTTAVDTKGITTISDANGVKTILDPSGATTIVDPSGRSTIIDSSGATTIFDQDRSKTIIDQNGNTIIVDLKGSTSLMGTAEQTTAAESAVATRSLDFTQSNDGLATSATDTLKKSGVRRRGPDRLMIIWWLGVCMVFLGFVSASVI